MKVEKFLERGIERKVWRITETGVKVKIRVKYWVAKGEKLEVDYRVIVAAPEVEVEMLAAGVVEGEKELNMSVEFLRGARGSFGVVKDEVLIVGRGRNISRPIILSAEKEATGRHGTTVGRVDERAVKYLCSRGIKKKRAKEILIRARLGV
ncbi:MAG: SufD family Fe-S cluster assembly protein [Candidatus Saccharibacteria bacterium]|nr:SufD family Fe-S cluster assembly protein [Candidatus Saccharibacteria bacterium]